MNISGLEYLVKEQEGIDILTRKQIETIQLRKLNRLLKREKEWGGFYSELPETLSDLKELSGLPFTTEQELKESGNRMLLLSQSEIERVRTEKTSGTTGQAKRVFYSVADHERTISFFAAGLSELVFPGEKTMICMPFSGPGGLGELIAEAIRRLGACPIAAGIEKSYGELLQILERERPETFVGMPVPLLSLFRLNPEISLKRALVSADACPEAVMSEIERMLGSRLYPHYGSREMGLGGAVTCPAFHGMHLRENDIIAEIIDETGKTLPIGQWGELVITTIQAEAMPLIRYRTGDHTRILPEPCPCGSVLARLDRVTRAGKSKSCQMYELDEQAFRIPELIDYRAELINGSLHLYAYVSRSGGDFPKELCGYPAYWNLSPVSGKIRPCYPAKRRILESV